MIAFHKGNPKTTTLGLYKHWWGVMDVWGQLLQWREAVIFLALPGGWDVIWLKKTQATAAWLWPWCLLASCFGKASGKEAEILPGKLRMISGEYFSFVLRFVWHFVHCNTSDWFVRRYEYGKAWWLEGGCGCAPQGSPCVVLGSFSSRLCCSPVLVFSRNPHTCTVAWYLLSLCSEAQSQTTSHLPLLSWVRDQGDANGY